MAPTLFIASVLAAVEDRFRSTDEQASAEKESQATGEPASKNRRDPGEPRTSLFQCPDCDRVYVADDEHTCSSCETNAERVPSTLSDVP